MSTTSLPNAPVTLTPASQRISVGRPRPSITPGDLKKVEEEQLDKADYKIELVFDSRRSARLHKLVPFFATIWESGKRLHGGGDDKMYWCGYDDCNMPIRTREFAYSHTVCPSCKREVFRSLSLKMDHIHALSRENRRSNGIECVPVVCGERFCNLPPSKIADLLVKLWYQLEGKADVYFKHTPRKIRYDSLHETTRDLNNLEAARVERKPGIYTLASIRKDLASGSDLKNRFLSWVVA